MSLGTPAYFDQYKLDIGKGFHAFQTHTLKIMLSNTAPNTTTGQVKADITEISAGNGYTAGGTALTSLTWTKSGGTATLAAANLVFTASGGSIGPFTHGVLYNDSQTTPVKPLIWTAAESGAITLANGESYTITLTNAASET